jgi:hypothetical protein
MAFDSASFALPVPRTSPSIPPSKKRFYFINNKLLRFSKLFHIFTTAISQHFGTKLTFTDGQTY